MTCGSGHRQIVSSNRSRHRSARRARHWRARCASSASCAKSSARTGTASSAAAVGVGARRSAAWSINVVSVSCPTAEISGIGELGRGPHHLLLVERPQILDRAAAARDDQQVRPRHDRGKAANRLRDPGRSALSLDRHRPHDDPGRAAILEAVDDVADHRAGRRGDDSDHLRKERQPALARGIEQALGGERLAPPLEQRQQGALARQLHAVDDDLIFGAAGIGRELAGRDDFGAVLGPECERPGAGAPDHGVDARILVLEGEVAMARAVPLEPGDFAAHADLAEGVLDRALERSGKLADAERRRIVAGGDLR